MKYIKVPITASRELCGMCRFRCPFLCQASEYRVDEYCSIFLPDVTLESNIKGKAKRWKDCIASEVKE